MPSVVKQSAKNNMSGSVLDRIGSIEFGESDGIKMSLYGRSGSGKTTFWATFPKPILVILCSGGQKPGELRSINTPEYRKTIKQVVLQNTAEIKDIVDYLRAGGSNIATVVLDHATGLQDLTLKEILNLDEIPAQKSWGLARQQDWGQCAIQMKEMLRSILSVPQHSVIVAQEREFGSEENAEIVLPYVGSALMPSVAGWLNPACDYIVQTFIRQKEEEVETKLGNQVVKTKRKTNGVEYCLRTAPHQIYTTKFRIPKGRILPEVVVNPTFQKIYKLIQGG